MKKTILLLLLLCIGVINGQNEDLYVTIDSEHQDLFKFNKELSKEKGSSFSSIKIIVVR